VRRPTFGAIIAVVAITTGACTKPAPAPDVARIESSTTVPYTFDRSATTLPLGYEGESIDKVIDASYIKKAEFETTTQFRERQNRVPRQSVYAFKIEDAHPSYDADKQAFGVGVYFTSDVWDIDGVWTRTKNAAIQVNGLFHGNRDVGVVVDRALLPYRDQSDSFFVAPVPVPVIDAPSIEDHIGELLVCEGYLGSEPLILPTMDVKNTPHRYQFFVRVTSADLWAFDKRNGKVLVKTTLARPWAKAEK
jgi:hypothetical protein